MPEWVPDRRTVKTFGPYTMTSCVPKGGGETAHLVELADTAIRVLPDGSSTAKARGMALVAILTTLNSLGATSPMSEDMRPTLLVGHLAIRGLAWEMAGSDVTIEEWLTNWWDEQGVERPDRAARDLLGLLALDGWVIVRKAET